MYISKGVCFVLQTESYLLVLVPLINAETFIDLCKSYKIVYAHQVIVHSLRLAYSVKCPIMLLH